MKRLFSLAFVTASISLLGACGASDEQKAQRGEQSDVMRLPSSGPAPAYTDSQLNTQPHIAYITAKDIDGLEQGQKLVLEPNEKNEYIFDTSHGPIDFQRIYLRQNGNSVTMDKWLDAAKNQTGVDYSNVANGYFTLGSEAMPLESNSHGAVTPWSPTSRPCLKCVEICALVCVRVCIISSC